MDPITVLIVLGLAAGGVYLATRPGNPPNLPPFHRYGQNAARKLTGDPALVGFDTQSAVGSPLGVRVLGPSTNLLGEQGYSVQVEIGSPDPALAVLPVGAVFNAPIDSIAA